MNTLTETEQGEAPSPACVPGHCPSPLTCTLNRVRAGALVRIKQLSAPPEVSKRLREIGFGEDQVIKLVIRQSNLICQVCNARLALSSQLAQLILVEPMPAYIAA